MTRDPATERSVALMRFLAREARCLGVAEHVYVVGGAVRNWIIERPIKDVDVVIDSLAAGVDSEFFANKVMAAIPSKSRLATNQYGVAIITVTGSWELNGYDLKGEVVEIANARKESYGGAEGKGYKPHLVEPASIKDDVVRREFTVNTLMWRLSDLLDGPSNAEVVDLTLQGWRDVQLRHIRCPRGPYVVFRDDPTRLLRAVKFVAKYGFQIPADLQQDIRNNAHRMKQAPPEAIGTILVHDILEQPTARKALCLMDQLGLLPVIVEMVQEHKPFAAHLAGALRNADLQLLLDWMALGMPPATPLSFLSDGERDRLRFVSSSMEPDDQDTLLRQLVKPLFDNRAVIERFGIPEGPERAALRDVARRAILEDPQRAFDPAALQRAVEEKWDR